MVRIYIYLQGYKGAFIESVWNTLVPVSDLKTINQAKQFADEHTARNRVKYITRFIDAPVTKTKIEVVNNLPFRFKSSVKGSENKYA